MSDSLSGPAWWPLGRALLRPPDQPVSSPEDIDFWGYARARDLPLAQAQHRAFSAALESAGVEVVAQSFPVPGAHADACYTCDPALMTPAGAIILAMGNPNRTTEPAAMEVRLAELGVPVVGRIAAPGTVEGGDCLWLDSQTLAVGEGFRTNPAGIAQLQALLPNITVTTIQLPWLNGPAECLHLQSLVSWVGEELAVVHRSLSPVRLLRALEERNVTVLPLPPSEFDSLGSNILCVRDRQIIMAANNPLTAALLRSQGVDVTELDAEDLMWVGTGGPTCLTFPLRRTPPT